jgi:hypothetical protein
MVRRQEMHLHIILFWDHFLARELSAYDTGYTISPETTGLAHSGRPEGRNDGAKVFFIQDTLRK